MGSFGERLRAIRGIIGLSQADFGKSLEIRAKDISRYETGEYSINPDVMTKLAQKGINMEWLVTESGYPFRGIGIRLRTARESRQLKAPDLAARLGTTKEEVYRYEDGKETPSEEWIEKVAAATACDLKWLRTGWDREGNYTPNIFLPAVGAPPVAAGEDRHEQLAVSEEAPVYSAQVMPLSVAVHQAYLLLEKAEKERNVHLVPEYKGMVIGHLADFIIRGRPQRDIEALTEALLKDLPKKTDGAGGTPSAPA